MNAEELAEQRAVVRGTAEIFQALGDATRLTIVIQLARGGGRSIAELTEGTGLTRQAVTKHLRVLEEAGVVDSRTQGREKLYELDGEPVAEAMNCLDMVSAEWEMTVGRAKRFVGE